MDSKYLHAGKTEIIIFKRKHQLITKHLNLRVSGQKINPTFSVKHVEVFLNDSLTWTTHLTNLIPKLNRAILDSSLHTQIPFKNHLLLTFQL